MNSQSNAGIQVDSTEKDLRVSMNTSIRIDKRTKMARMLPSFYKGVLQSAEVAIRRMLDDGDLGIDGVVSALLGTIFSDEVLDNVSLSMALKFELKADYDTNSDDLSAPTALQTQFIKMAMVDYSEALQSSVTVQREKSKEPSGSIDAVASEVMLLIAKELRNLSESFELEVRKDNQPVHS